MSEKLSSPAPTEMSDDNKALYEAYTGGSAPEAEAPAPELTPEAPSESAAPETKPETNETNETIKDLNRQIKELQARLSELTDRLSTLAAGGTSAEVITPSTFASPTEHPASESYVRELIPEATPDYLHAHDEKMGILTERGQEARDRAYKARQRRTERRRVRELERGARQAERQDRRSELKDKATTKLRSWGRAALRGTGRGLRAVGRAVKGAAVGAREAVKSR